MKGEHEAVGRRYGPWALVVGGSDGLGAAIASELAADGINLVLVARHAGKLETAANDLCARHGVEVRTQSIDLESEDAARMLVEATAGIDLGFVAYNAGADTSGAHFIDRPFDFWLSVIQRNILTLTRSLYDFAARFAQSGRGGILIVGSEAAFGGGGRVAIYSATKGYALNLGESLWAELKPHGVDVLNLVFAIADTPSLRSVLDARKIPVEATGATAVGELAKAALANMAHGPTYVWGQPHNSSDTLRSPDRRRERCLTATATMDGLNASGGN